MRLVARRELVERLRDRGFHVSTALTLAVLLALVTVPAVVGGPPPRASYAVGLVDRGLEYGPRIVAAAREVPADVRLEVLPDLAAGRERLLDTDDPLDAVVTGDQLLVESEPPAGLVGAVQTAVRGSESARRLAAAGIDLTAVTLAQDVPALPVRALAPPPPGVEQDRQLALVTVLLLYGQLLAYGFWVALGVVEEKSSRVVELLLAAVRPRELLAGKVLGIGLLGLVQLTALAAVGVAAATATGTLELPGRAVGPVLVGVGGFLVGYALYATAFAAAAATVSRSEELQHAVTPLTLLVLVAFGLGVTAAADPDGRVAAVATYLPPVAPLVVPPRVVAGEIGAGEVALALALCLAALAALLVLADRVYRHSLLRTGGRVRLREAWRAGR